RGNRLISVKSESGKQLYQPGRIFVEQQIQVDGKMSESAWKQAPVITSLTDKSGYADPTTVRVLYDRANIYLFWDIDQPDGLTSQTKEADEVITGDDYIQVDLKPWIPDSIKYGRDYYYSIAVNPDGVVWDAYLDPYLDGFYFGSWDSDVKVTTARESNHWEAEMVIPYAGLDVYSNPGWKWNLEFHHASRDGNSARVTSSNIGLTVQQDVMVRQPGLVSYYWPRANFMQEVKPDLTVPQPQEVRAEKLNAPPTVNKTEDDQLWTGAQRLSITHTDKMGEVLSSNTASAMVGMTNRNISFNLQANGARIEEGPGAQAELGAGMAGQMAGVNGVFVDPALFANECFWIVLQPRSTQADDIHQDYYMIIVNNRGKVSGTHYDKFGAPFRTWQPKADVDLYNTSNGWGAEVVLDLSSFDIPVNYNTKWGINIFRNRLLDDGYELQAWRYTGNDFLNPEKFGSLTNVAQVDPAVLRSNVQRKSEQLQAQLRQYRRVDRRLVRRLNQELNGLQFNSNSDLLQSEKTVEQMNHTLGVLDAVAQYASVPHPAEEGFPVMDVQFIGDHGWAVGAMGTILRTDDRGSTWEKVPLESDADLYRVDFVNANEGWAAG
ncbi:MAG: YCF48-related protein, partial [Calditrichota bacterium]